MINELTKSLELVNELKASLSGNQSESFLVSYLVAVETELQRQKDTFTSYNHTKEVIDSKELYNQSLLGNFTPLDTKLPDLTPEEMEKTLAQLQLEKLPEESQHSHFAQDNDNNDCGCS